MGGEGTRAAPRRAQDGHAPGPRAEAAAEVPVRALADVEAEHAEGCHTMYSRANDGAGSVVSTGQNIWLWQLCKHALEPT